MKVGESRNGFLLLFFSSLLYFFSFLLLKDYIIKDLISITFINSRKNLIFASNMTSHASHLNSAPGEVFEFIYFIKHYKSKYFIPKTPPACMALEVISLGTLSPLYELLNKDDKKNYSKTSSLLIYVVSNTY